MPLPPALSVRAGSVPRRSAAPRADPGPRGRLPLRAVGRVAGGHHGPSGGGRRMSFVTHDHALMEVRDLAVRFKTRGGVARAVDGVSLDWRRGEVLGVVGESGCGKSTLARAMLGLVEPAAGEVKLDGGGIAGKGRLRELRRRVQMIFQDPYQT